MDSKKLVKALKALAHPHRLDLFMEIARKEGMACDPECGQCLISGIKDSLHIGAPTVSHHMKELINADLITTERDGRFLQARVNRKLLGEIIKALSV